MPRAKKTDAPDLSERVNLTAGAIERMACPDGKQQAFMRDSEAPGLRVRVTAPSTKNPKGLKAFVYEAKLNRQTIRRTIGDVKLWSIEQARTEARRLAVVLDGGQDPRELERQQQAAQAADMAAAAAQVEADKVAAVTVGEVWAVYVAERKPKWGDLHRADHERLARAGGKVSSRGTRGLGVTVAGPLHPLMALPLRDLSAPAIEAWAAREAQTRPTAARLAWRLLKAFLGWCAEQTDPATKKHIYAALLPTANPAKTKKAREALGKPKAKDDSLLKEQLPAWFAAVQSIGNSTVAAYLQVCLLTGARPGEVLALRWSDINTQWRGLTIRDKVQGTREIPATPYVLHLLAALPRRNEFVFASSRNEKTPITEPNHAHDKACAVAGIEGLTLHGLRRSFGTLSEWLEVPAGIVAQIQGHKPSATVERHYRVRPLDLLRVHHKKIESWILKQARIAFDAKAAPGALRVVQAA